MSLKASFAAVCVAAFAVLVSADANGPLTNDDVLCLTMAGVGKAAIVAKIKSSETDFETGVGDVARLVFAGVDDKVVARMVKANASGVTSAGAAPCNAGSSRALPKPGYPFHDGLCDGENGPAMVVVPAGSFCMGCVSNDDQCESSEKPPHNVTIESPFALSVHKVTVEDYHRFAPPDKVNDEGATDSHSRVPVTNVSWNDARRYAQWLSTQTGERYRLASEAEWEYAARAGSSGTYNCDPTNVNCANCESRWDNKQTASEGAAPDAFGLHYMHSNVWEWVQDCWYPTYRGAPTDGSARLVCYCTDRVLRGGCSPGTTSGLGTTQRRPWSSANRHDGIGFRVARKVVPESVGAPPLQPSNGAIETGSSCAKENSSLAASSDVSPGTANSEVPEHMQATTPDACAGTTPQT